MNYKTINPYEEEQLPWPEYIPVYADKIILGTFPTKKDNRGFDFFYPNKNNKFWNVLARIANFNLSNYENNEEGRQLAVTERKQILDKINLAITDIGSKILRQKGSSLDSNLFPIEFSNIFSILDSHPLIQLIILTSSSKGNSVLTWFSTYCEINNVQLKIDKKKKDYPIRTEIKFNNKKIKVAIVYSTSGAAGKTEDSLIKQYMNVIEIIS